MKGGNSGDGKSRRGCKTRSTKGSFTEGIKEAKCRPKTEITLFILNTKCGL